jgi:hypothetical protein
VVEENKGASNRMTYVATSDEDLWALPHDEVQYEDWSSLVRALSRPSPAWIFRGMGRPDWRLHANLARVLRGNPAWPPNEWEMAERSAIGFFKQHARATLPNPPGELDLIGWLALMRHYGAPTRLLDWSASPFVACYFAFDACADDSDAMLWALQAFYCRLMTSPGSTYPFDETGTFPMAVGPPENVHFLALEVTRPEAENRRLRGHMYSKSPWPMPLLPHWLDARMAAQQAVFTAVGEIQRPADAVLGPSEYSQDPPGRNTLKNPQRSVPADRLERLGLPTSGVSETWQVIRKIRLPAEWRSEALDALDRMGINQASLFPGLDGIGRATAEHLRRETYALRDILAPQPQEADLPETPLSWNPPG